MPGTGKREHPAFTKLPFAKLFQTEEWPSPELVDTPDLSPLFSSTAG